MKPPYRIPSRAEILNRPSNGFTVVSTFSGAGGSCLGYRWAGYRVLYANEFIKAARETYAANFPNAVIDDRDIREVSATDITNAIDRDIGDIDIFEGSPPCSSFSTAGRRDKLWGQVKPYSDTRQRTDDLFDEWIRLVDALQPRVCIAENVPALASGKAVGHYKRITRAITNAGYTVKATELNAMWLGVPQRRKRLFIIGVRSDLERLPVFPKPLPYWYSIREALPGITHIESANGWNGHAYKPTDTVVETIQANRPIKVLETSPRFDRQLNTSEPYAIYDEWIKLKEGAKSTKYRNLMRADSSKASPTVTQAGGNASTASVTHPSEPRKFTIAELKRISGFPDDFELTGTYRQQYERIGRAVCPPVTKAIGETIERYVLR
jgi:DNA (cytosine-5)-methyltransferase 1